MTVDLPVLFIFTLSYCAPASNSTYFSHMNANQRELTLHHSYLHSQPYNQRGLMHTAADNHKPKRMVCCQHVLMSQLCLYSVVIVMNSGVRQRRLVRPTPHRKSQ